VRTRVALLVGFGVGYYAGAKAGRARYEQLHEVVTKVGALGRLGVERLRGPEDADVVTLRPTANGGAAQPSSR
jgi:hypothetical protein